MHNKGEKNICSVKNITQRPFSHPMYLFSIQESHIHVTFHIQQCFTTITQHLSKTARQGIINNANRTVYVSRIESSAYAMPAMCENSIWTHLEDIIYQENDRSLPMYVTCLQRFTGYKAFKHLKKQVLVLI